MRHPSRHVPQGLLEVFLSDRLVEVFRDPDRLQTPVQENVVALADGDDPHVRLANIRQRLHGGQLEVDPGKIDDQDVGAPGAVERLDRGIDGAGVHGCREFERLGGGAQRLAALMIVQVAFEADRLIDRERD